MTLYPELKDSEKIFADAQDDDPEVFRRQACEAALQLIHFSSSLHLRF